MIRPGPPFGSFATLELANDRARIIVCPALGARVLSLVDLWTDREWLVAGEPPALGPAGDAPAWSGPDAAYDGVAAFGWDECLPTVAPCADPGDPAAPPLRDHGDLWGRPADVLADGAVLAATWPGEEAARPRPAYRFTRRLRLDGPRVVADYVLENGGPDELPVLWSMHALLALDPGARLEVEGLVSVRVAWATGLSISPVPGRADWPETPGTDGRPVALDVVRDPSAGTALRAFGGWELYGGWDGAAGEGLPGVAAAAQPDGGRLELTWYAPIAPNLGIWLDDGGWPAAPDGPRVQHALQPTTSPDDELTSAIAAGRALVLAPAERVAWSATLRLRAPGEPRGV
jgi:hypothetical protein